MIGMIRIIILRWAPRRGPLGHPGGTSGRPPASLTSWMLKTFRFPLLLRPTDHLSPLGKLPQAPQKQPECTDVLRKITVCGQNLLQTAATATFCARDGPESSYGSSYLHFTAAANQECQFEQLGHKFGSVDSDGRLIQSAIPAPLSFSEAFQEAFKNLSNIYQNLTAACQRTFENSRDRNLFRNI